MKRRIILIPILLLCSASAFAQKLAKKGDTTIVSERRSMTGAEWAKIAAAMKFAPGIYDADLKRIDSANAVKLAKTYEYGISTMQKEEGGLWYRVLRKINLKAEAERDAQLQRDYAPKNPALQKGQILDLKPFGNRIPESKVAGKGIILLFWYPGFKGNGNAFADHNEIIANYIDKGNFEFYAVTKYSYEQATMALRSTPINNAHHMFDSAELLDIYSPDNKPLIIVTDKEHKITYSVVNNLGITPRILNGLLKNM